MSPRIVLASLALIAVASAALFLAPSIQAGNRAPIDVQPLDEAAHAALVARLFGGVDEAAAEEVQPVESSAAALQSSGGTVTVPVSSAGALPVSDPSWRRIDTFGIRQTWGWTNPAHAATSPIAVVFDTVVVPPAYQHCLQHYDVVTDLEVRLVPTGGGAPVVVHATRLPGDSSVSIVVPAALWRNTQSGRILAWSSSGDPTVDDSAVSDQEFP